MEYFGTEDGQIQADLARRLSIILKQYHNQIFTSEKYEVTLCLLILQTLLINIVELLNGLKTRDEQTNPLYQYPIDRDNWGVDERNINLNTFNQPNLTVEKTIRHVRNALSHPTKIKIASKEKTRGYTTWGIIDYIEMLKFVSSPDLNAKGNIKKYKMVDNAIERIKSESNFPADLQVYETEQTDFIFQQNGKPFHRIFEIELTPTD